MQVKFLCEFQSSFSFPATDDIPWGSAYKTKPTHYTPVWIAACFFVLFLGWGWGGALAFIKKTGVWGSILLTIYVLVYYILFVHCLQLWLLSLNAMCCGLQLVLWFHLLALLNLGSRLQGFIWRSADKVPAWKSGSFWVPATDDILWVPADQHAKLSHYRLVSNAAGFFAE